MSKRQQRQTRSNSGFRESESQKLYLGLFPPRMASKVLLGLNAAAVFTAYFLYANGVRLTLDDEFSDAALNSLIFPHVGMFSSPAASTPASWGGSGELANYSCTNARMQPKFLSYDPVMVYIENFMSPFETEYLKKLA